jgi:hypothetical protein
MIPYHLAAERTRRVMYSVEVICECPDCGEGIGCRVDGTDVTIIDACLNACHTRSHFDRDALDSLALALAATERTGYLHHLRDGGL